MACGSHKRTMGMYKTLVFHYMAEIGYYRSRDYDRLLAHYSERISVVQNVVDVDDGEAR